MDAKKPSKTARKKEMTALQKMGEMLIALPEKQLENIDMPDELRELIYVAKSLKSHEAKRRQLQFIGKKMRHIDPETILLALKKNKILHDQDILKFHQAEEWREKLIANTHEALPAFIATFKEADQKQVLELIHQAQKNKETKKNTGAESALFKYVRSFL